MNPAKDPEMNPKKSDPPATVNILVTDAQPEDAQATKEKRPENPLLTGSVHFPGCCSAAGVNGLMNDTAHQGLFSAFSRTLIRVSSLTSGKRLVFIGLLLLAASIIFRHF